MAKDFLNKWILEPIDDLLFNSMKVAEKVGVWEPFRNFFYQGEGLLSMFFLRNCSNTM